MGNTVAVADATGKVIEQYSYEAFGSPTIRDSNGNPLPNNESAVNNRILFAGREWVSRFGFYENRARAYHPGLGRFSSEDPLGFGAGDANLFRYCGNDPINWADPSGLFTGQIGGLFSGTFMGAGLYSFGGGIVFDGYGNVGYYRSAFVGGGVGTAGGLGVGASGSDADTITGLEGAFSEASGTASVGGYEGTGSVFRGTDQDSGELVTGGGVSMGLGTGYGAASGVSNTHVVPLFNIFGSPMPAPGGSTAVDGDCRPPDCVTTERLTVTGVPIESFVNRYNYNAPGYDANGMPAVPGYSSGYYGGSPGTLTGYALSFSAFAALYIPGGGPLPGEGSWKYLVTSDKY